MKYYLHSTDSMDDEKIAELYLEFGYEGVGLFHAILEKIAKQEKPVKTQVLKKQLHVGKKLEKVWKFMEEIGLICSNNGETFNEQLLNFSEKYKIKSEKNAKKVSEWRERQKDVKDVTGYVPVCNPGKVKESKVNKSKRKEKEEKENYSAASAAYSLCMTCYNDFVLKITTCNADINSVQGASLKKIITYLEKNVKPQPATSEKIVEALQFIFDNYDLWDDFHKKQLKLNQIHSNLVNIINKIRNHKALKTLSKKERGDAAGEEYLANLKKLEQQPKLENNE